WNERALSAFKRSARLAEIPAKAGSVDAACETIHGLSAFGHAAVSSLRAGGSTRLGRSDLGKLLSPGDQHRLLDERRVRSANVISSKANCGLHAHACSRAGERNLFYRRQISIYQCRISR